MALSFGDAIKASQNFDFGAYKEPAGFDVDFFSPDQTSSINWADIYANPDVLKGYGDGYSSSFDSLSDKATDYIQQIADKEQENKFLENQKANQIFQQVSPSVTLTRDGVPTGMNPYGSSGTYGNIAAGLSGLQGAFRPAGSAFGISDIAKMGGSALASKALYAVNPVLGAVNQFYPGGIQQGFKDVTRFAGDAFGGIAKGVGGAVKGVGDFLGGLFCDERLKVDIAPLESTEVNDELAQMAFFVKGLRECS
jgi:hypothetical protein